MSNPERLYHFTTSKFALDDLRNRRLKIAQFDDLNDPVELKSVNLCDPNNAKDFDGVEELDFEGYKAAMARQFGVLCFSEEKTDVLQWTHYADRHKGICLGFDVSASQENFGQVQYVTERCPFPEKEKLNFEFSWKLLSTKSMAWSYEREWRVFTTLKDGIWNESAGRVLYFEDFGPELVLQEVILGAESKTPISDIRQALHGHPEIVRVSRMRLSCDKFELQEHPVRG